MIATIAIFALVADHGRRARIRLVIRVTVTKPLTPEPRPAAARDECCESVLYAKSFAGSCKFHAPSTGISQLYAGDACFLCLA